MNTSGKRVSDALRKLPDTGEDSEYDEFLATGRRYRDELAKIVHKDRHWNDFDEGGMRSWLRTAWGMEADFAAIDEGMAAGLSLQEAQFNVMLERWVRTEGLTAEEAAKILLQRQKEGRPLPWDEPDTTEEPKSEQA
jgi:hypothetical protein